VRRPTLEQLAWLAALICGVAPLWATQALPLVDLPQHLHLISALHRLGDASTLYPEVFARRPELTPYLGYYYVVSGLNWLLPLELANRVFLSAYVAGLPLALAFLLKSLRRPTWPALLALPFAYGDSFAWGFINYCASLPLALLTCGFFVRAIEDAPRRRAWAGALAASLVVVLLFHVQTFAWLGVALPFLLLTTPAPEGRGWRARVPALVGVVPGVLLFVLWVGLRVGQPQEIAPGQPWRSWGPMLSKENLGWKSPEQNLAEFVSVPRTPEGALQLGETRFPVLAGVTSDGADHRAVRLVFLVALGAVLLALAHALQQARRDATGLVPTLVAAGRQLLTVGEPGPVARWRMLGLAALAFALYFALPFDIRGYMYYLNTRYAHLAAALLVGAVPALAGPWPRRALFVAASTAVVLLSGLWPGFKAFDQESKALAELSTAAAPKARVMGLLFATQSRVMTHPVYLHAACDVARAAGGLTNFSFALTPHNPLMYRGPPPPTFPSEWRPHEMRWEQHGRHYDHFVVRGVRPEQLFGGLLQTELTVAAQAGDFFLVRKR
jgi:hypothetical protein